MFYFIYLIITTTANYTIDHAEAKDNVKLAQLYLEGQYIDLLQHLNQLFIPNTFLKTVFIPYPGSLIDPKEYEENHFSQDNDDRLAIKNYLDEWQSQTDANKSIILQTIAQYFGKGLMGQPVQCIKQKQEKLIENNQNRQGQYDYLTPIPWQHVYLTQQQYKLSKFFAIAYEKNITIEQAFQSLPRDEQKEIYETYCRFFEIPIIVEPTPPPPRTPTPPPPPPRTPTPPPPSPPPQRHSLNKEKVLLIMILAVIFSLSAYYIKILINSNRFSLRILDRGNEKNALNNI